MEFGKYLKDLREERHLLQRELAAILKMDTALLSKIERGTRKARRDQVIAFAEAFDIDKNEVMKQWMADQIAQMLEEQTNPNEILKVAEEKINYLKTKKTNDNKG